MAQSSFLHVTLVSSVLYILHTQIHSYCKDGLCSVRLDIYIILLVEYRHTVNQILFIRINANLMEVSMCICI